MSELAKTLELFGFLSIDDITHESLKKAFITRILQAHPDKGGNSDSFDEMLHSYVYLTETVQRISGGRSSLKNITSPDELKRTDEIVNKFFEEFQNDEFNRQFEKQKKETHGYESWFKMVEEPKNIIFDEKDLNKVFEETFTRTDVTSLVLHPEAMALVPNIGTSLVDDNCYTSDVFANPEYTDLYSAFTNNNIICDKLDFKKRSVSFESLVEERNKEIEPLNDEELKAIQDYEKKKLAKVEATHFVINL